jgi:hypothetical protein
VVKAVAVLVEQLAQMALLVWLIQAVVAVAVVTQQAVN